MSAEAELLKLAHLLAVPPEHVQPLAQVPEADLRTLRAQVGEAMFQADRHHFVRLATLARAVPAAMIAKLAEVALPPLLAARAAELLDPTQAADLVRRLPVRYLTEVASAMDPARAAAVVGAIPADLVASVAAELARREQWVVIGAFVAHVSPAALTTAVAQFDGAALLRIGYVLDDPDRLDDIGASLTDGQLDLVLAAAVQDDLWAELTVLIEHLLPLRRARLAQRYARLAVPVQSAFDAAAVKHALDPAIVAILQAS